MANSGCNRCGSSVCKVEVVDWTSLRGNQNTSHGTPFVIKHTMVDAQLQRCKVQNSNDELEWLVLRRLLLVRITGEADGSPGNETQVGGCMTHVERAAFAAALSECDVATVDFCPAGAPATHFSRHDPSLGHVQTG